MNKTSSSENASTVRLDKWLWAARFFKTRSQATEACRAGWIKADDQRIKPSTAARPGLELRIRRGSVERIIRINALLERRVSASQAQEHYEEVTPPEAFELARQRNRVERILREPGTGRPTKRERRKMEELREDL